MSVDPPPLVRLRGIRKSYGTALANDGVDLSLYEGEVHALLGENGAGKTTLMRILYGLTSLDVGEIEVRGEVATIASPADAIGFGIGMVTQHFSLVRTMTVTENIVLSDVGLGRVDLAAARARVVESADQLGIRVDADARVGDLSVGEQQRVEILKALYHDCRVLILDEPTAVLVPQDVDALFATIRRLTGVGLGVLFISHKLHEVTAVSDRITVLRRGRVVETVPNDGVDGGRLAELMVGRPMLGVRPTGVTAQHEGRAVAPTGRAQSPSSDGRAVLEVDRITVPGRGRRALHQVSLQVRSGEIVGVAGVSGNGQRELVDVLCGMTTPTAGAVRIAGAEVTGADPGAMVAAGLGRITEDRHGSVVSDLSVEQNLVLESLEHYRRGPFLDRRRIRAHAEQLIDRFAIKAAPTDPVGSLSGGNVQKLILARVLARDPSAIVAAQPTRGLDVGAAEYVHTQLLDRRAAGAAVLLVSEDLDELLALADRIIVLFAGAIAGEMPVAGATRDRLGPLMAGQAA